MANYERRFLAKDGAKPLARWLIAAVQNQDTLTYGEAKQRLEILLGISNIFPIHMGDPAGQLMDLIHGVEPGAPLLNTLLVRESDKIPGDGVGSYMAKKFKVPKLAEQGARKKYKDDWCEYFEQAKSEVMSFEHWPELFEKAFNEEFNPHKILLQNLSNEKNHQQFGAGGEGPAHMRLKFWVKNNPGEVCSKGKPIKVGDEVGLKSGDKVDVVYCYPNTKIAVEVKSYSSDKRDLERGVYQCIKYRAVMEVEAIESNKNLEILCYLVTEKQLPDDLQALCERHSVRTMVKTW